RRGLGSRLLPNARFSAGEKASDVGSVAINREKSDHKTEGDQGWFPTPEPGRKGECQRSKYGAQRHEPGDGDSNDEDCDDRCQGGGQEAEEHPGGGRDPFAASKA